MAQVRTIFGELELNHGTVEGLAAARGEAVEVASDGGMIHA